MSTDIIFYIVFHPQWLTSIYSSGHMTFIQRRLNVDATSWRCIDVEATLYWRHAPAGMFQRNITRIWNYIDVQYGQLIYSVINYASILSRVLTQPVGDPVQPVLLWLPFSMTKGDNFCNFLFAFLHIKFLPKRSSLKGKNLLTRGAIFFLLG